MGVRSMIKLKSLINEVRIINSKKFYNEPPLRDNETIRLYHGFYSLMDAIVFSLHGMSGKEYADRVYSYEAVNNPKGLFVTPDFNIAKKFTHLAVMEFDAKVSDLEAPVWVGGRGYFGQGEYTSGFSDRGGAEREHQRLLNREKAKQSKYSQISQSDRPELAEWIFGGESQALFIGDLNPNMIRQFWVSKEGIEHGRHGPYIRMSKKEFLKTYGMPYIQKLKKDSDERAKQQGWYGFDPSLEKVRKGSHKLLKPADDFNKEIAIANLKAQYGSMDLDFKFDEWVEMAQNGDLTAIRQMNNWFWPKQLKQMGIEHK